MRNHPFFRFSGALPVLCMLFLHFQNTAYAQKNTPATATQTAWNRLSITNAGAKIVPRVQKSRFNLHLYVVWPLGGIEPQRIDYSTLQAVVNAPGPATGQSETTILVGGVSTGQSAVLRGHAHAIAGLRLGACLGQKFEGRFAAGYFLTTWSGDFPFQLLSAEQEHNAPPATMVGALKASVHGVAAEASVACLISTGKLQPFISMGLRAQIPLRQSGTVAIGDTRLPVEVHPLDTAYSPLGSAGIRLNCLQNGFVEMEFTYGKVVGSGYFLMPGAGAGWKF